MGWPAPHRVVANEATERWLGGDPRGPAWVRAVNRLTAPLASRIQPAPGGLPVRAQRPGIPLFSPLAPTKDARGSMLEASPLYAGESVARVDVLRSAGALVRELAGM